MADFAELYGTKRWGLSAYAGNTALVEHYINLLLGNYYVKDVNAKAADRLVGTLQKTHPVETPWRKARTESLTPSTIEKIFKLLHCAWKQAIRWDMALRNPFGRALLPKKETKTARYLERRDDPIRLSALPRRKPIHCHQSGVCLLRETR